MVDEKNKDLIYGWLFRTFLNKDDADYVSKMAKSNEDAEELCNLIESIYCKVDYEKFSLKTLEHNPRIEYLIDVIEERKNNRFHRETIYAEDLIKSVLEMKNKEYGDEANGLIPFNVQRFNEFSLAYHHEWRFLAGLWGFKDKNGNIIIEPRYLFEPIECDGLYIVCEGSGWEESSEWTKGKFWSKEQRWGVIDKNFNTIIPLEYDEITWLKDDAVEGYENLRFGCYKYKYEETDLKWVTIFDRNGKVIIPEKYNDVGYSAYYNQLIIYKDRERWGDNDTKGFAGVYDFNINKMIIEPDIYAEMEYLDYNIFLVSDDIEDMSKATIINNKKQIIGEEKIWESVYRTYSNKQYKYQGKTMDGKMYKFNIVGCEIVDKIEIDAEEWMKL